MAKDAAIDFAKGIYNGVKEQISSIPNLVTGVFKSAIQSVTDLISSAWSAAKRFASSMWSGFQDGLGIHSPSYIEEALFAIQRASKDTLSGLRSDLSKLARIPIRHSWDTTESGKRNSSSEQREPTRIEINTVLQNVEPMSLGDVARNQEMLLRRLGLEWGW